MPVTDVIKNPETLTITLIADLAAPPERVWQIWADPRQLERWWGPPTWPATFTEHPFSVGSMSRYHMTGPDGTQAHGWWRFLSIDEPKSIELEDGFADAEGNPDPTMPVGRMRVELEATDSGTRMTVISTQSSIEELEQLVAMGMIEGMTEAAGQIDAILAEG